MLFFKKKNKPLTHQEFKEKMKGTYADPDVVKSKIHEANRMILKAKKVAASSTDENIKACIRKAERELGRALDYACDHREDAFKCRSCREYVEADIDYSWVACRKFKAIAEAGSAFKQAEYAIDLFNMEKEEEGK